MQNRLGGVYTAQLPVGLMVKLGRKGRVSYQRTLRPRVDSDLNAGGAVMISFFIKSLLNAFYSYTYRMLF